MFIVHSSILREAAAKKRAYNLKGYRFAHLQAVSTTWATTKKGTGNGRVYPTRKRKILYVFKPQAGQRTFAVSSSM